MVMTTTISVRAWHDARASRKIQDGAGQDNPATLTLARGGLAREPRHHGGPARLADTRGRRLARAGSADRRPGAGRARALPDPRGGGPAPAVEGAGRAH